MIKEFFQPPTATLSNWQEKAGTIGAHIAANADLNPTEDCLALFSFGDLFVDIRTSFYGLAANHSDTQVIDLGMFIPGKTDADTHAGVKEVLLYLLEKGCRTVIISDNSIPVLGQWAAHKATSKGLDIAFVTPSLDQDPIDNILQILETEKEQVFHLGLVGMQGYYVKRASYEQLDGLFYDDLRLGDFRADTASAEPLFREADFANFDVSAIKYTELNASKTQHPNGLYNEEACLIARYMGISNKLKSISFTEIDPAKAHGLAASQLAQMIWYVLDGTEDAYNDAPNPNNNQFKLIRCPVDFASIKEITFLESLRSGRLWMQVPSANGNRWIGTATETLDLASKGEIPEQWFRAM